jgi:hypothetical protein
MYLHKSLKELRWVARERIPSRVALREVAAQEFVVQRIEDVSVLGATVGVIDFLQELLKNATYRIKVVQHGSGLKRRRNSKIRYPNLTPLTEQRIRSVFNQDVPSMQVAVLDALAAHVIQQIEQPLEDHLHKRYRGVPAVLGKVLP